jgi:hypothetical protein
LTEQMSTEDRRDPVHVMHVTLKRPTVRPQPRSFANTENMLLRVSVEQDREKFNALRLVADLLMFGVRVWLDWQFGIHVQ